MAGVRSCISRVFYRCGAPAIRATAAAKSCAILAGNAMARAIARWFASSRSTSRRASTTATACGCRRRASPAQTADLPAISTELPDGLPRILREADAKLRALRAESHGDAGGLAVAADATHARRIAKLLGEATGRAPVVVLHTETNAARKLADFRGSREPWVVAVNMVSEGVDIPRLRVGVYATAAKTPLIFRQIVGRFVRTIPGSRAEPGWLYPPADPTLRIHASEVETELRHALRANEPVEEGWEELLELPATEPSPAAEFVPLDRNGV